MPYSPASQKEQCLGQVWLAPNTNRQRSISQNAPLPRTLLYILSFGSWLEPRYIFAAGQLI
jgi:hypothetical protein